MRRGHERPEVSSVCTFHDSVNLVWLTSQSLSHKGREGPRKEACCTSFIIEPWLSVRSFTAQLPRGMQVQRDPPAQQLQRLRVSPAPRDLHCSEQTRTGKAGQQGVPSHDCHSLPSQDMRTLKQGPQVERDIFSIGILHK